MITVENHVLQGGFGSAVLELLADEGLVDIKVKRLGVPDRFIVDGTQEELRHLCGIDQESIVHAALYMIQEEKGRKNVTHRAS